jgi:hypothetical protein
MADYIDAISCDALAGAVQPTIAATQRWSQFGEDGNGLWVGNKRQQRTDLVSHHLCADQAAADAIVASARALVGTLVTITKGSQSLTNTAVESVAVEKSTAAAGLKGTGSPTPTPNTWLLVLRWSVMTSTSV